MNKKEIIEALIKKLITLKDKSELEYEISFTGKPQLEEIPFPENISVIKKYRTVGFTYNIFISEKVYDDFKEVKDE